MNITCVIEDSDACRIWSVAVDTKVDNSLDNSGIWTAQVRSHLGEGRWIPLVP